MMNKIYVPDLPAHALPSDAQRKAAERVTPWLQDWMEYCKSSAVTPPVFMRSAALWLIGTATARRAVLIPVRQPAVYNTHYLWWIAKTTYYKKSTGLYVIRRVAEHFNHLLLPDNATPELLKHIMAGQDSKNQEAMDEAQASRHTRGKKYAAQRGWMVDEACGLFEKDYQTGIINLLLQFDNNPNEVTTETLSRGKHVMERVGLNVLFADTPTAIAATFGSKSWHDGLFSRFAFITPGDAKVTLPPTRFLNRHEETNVPPHIVDPLLKLCGTDILDIPGSSPHIMSASTEAIHLYDSYKQATHDLTIRGDSLDGRLFGTYGRLPMHVLRVAMSLTLIDRASGEHSSLEITVGHMARAIEIVEEWRASAHEMLYHINRGPDAMNHESILRYLSRQSERKSLREIYEGAHMPSIKATQNALKDLQTEGTVAHVDSAGKEGYLLNTPDNIQAATQSGKYADFLDH